MDAEYKMNIRNEPTILIKYSVDSLKIETATPKAVDIRKSQL